MKRLILLLILFVNLQIVITHEDTRLFSYSTASAQHMTTVLYLKAKGYGYDTSHIYRYIMDNDPITKYQGMESEGARLNVHNYTHGDAHAISTMIGNISPTLKLK